jgi:hypothetical protein
MTPRKKETEADLKNQITINVQNPKNHFPSLNSRKKSEDLRKILQFV